MATKVRETNVEAKYARSRAARWGIIAVSKLVHKAREAVVFLLKTSNIMQATNVNTQSINPSQATCHFSHNGAKR